MTNLRQPISFLATSSVDEAKVFYAEVLRLTLVEQTPYALVFADGEHMLRVQIVPELHPAPYTVHGWKVADIDSETAALTARGVVFLTFDHLPQNALGIWTTPDNHKVAWFQDPSGNILSLTQFSSAAP